MARPFVSVLVGVAAVAGASLEPAAQEPAPPAEAELPAAEAELAAALRAYFAAGNARGPELAVLVKLAAGRESDLLAMLRGKTFLSPRAAATRTGVIDASYRFVDDDSAPNPALFGQPATTAGNLLPLVVYVPDTTDTARCRAEVQRDGVGCGRFVWVVPDEKRDNQWLASPHETKRHVQPLRDFLLQHAIDPDRLYFVGSGRGGHAAWDIGLMRSELWAGVFPCNGGLIHEGGYKATGGVFVGNGKDLTIFTVYNTSFDHGIDSCRYASRRLRDQGARFEATEEPAMRVMGLAEAMAKLAPVVRDPHRRTLTKCFNRLADGSHYWLQALDRRPREWDPRARIVVRGAWPSDEKQQLEVIWQQVQAECARLEGAIAGNTVRITAHGVGRLRLWLDPELLDFGGKVAITVNGQTKPAVEPARKLDVLLPRVHATGDTSRLYWDFVDLNVPP